MPSARMPSARARMRPCPLLLQVVKKRGEEYQLFWKDSPDFLRLAAKCNALVVPFAAVGAAASSAPTPAPYTHRHCHGCCAGRRAAAGPAAAAGPGRRRSPQAPPCWMRGGGETSGACAPSAQVGADDAYDVILDTEQILGTPVLGSLARALLQRVDPSLVPEESVLPLTRLPGIGLPAPFPVPNLQVGGSSSSSLAGGAACPPLPPRPAAPCRPGPATCWTRSGRGAAAQCARLPAPCNLRPLPPLFFHGPLPFTRPPAPPRLWLLARPSTPRAAPASAPPPGPQRLYFKFFEPLDTAGLDASDKQAVQEAYEAVRSTVVQVGCRAAPAGHLAGAGLPAC
jgi:hypothetical protein